MTTSIFDAFSNAEYGELHVEFDLRSQLIAIRHFLGRNKAAEAEVSAEIERLAESAKAASGDHADHLVDIWIEEMHGSVFHDGVNSLAAVGMLAPLIEGLFVQLFRHMGKLTEPEDTAHPRLLAAHRDLWDPHQFFRSGSRDPNLVEGVLQLADMTGLKAKLPEDTKTVLTALFSYRNAMLHNGLEWPAENRERFEARHGAAWPEAWFSSSRTGPSPWIFYMTPLFIERCLAFVDELMTAFGALIREEPPSAAV